jgi:D-glycero-D-manno-heptose 1,7-bisphosphate phosphatase
VTVDQVEEIHRRMITELSAGGARIDRVFYCPHRPDEKCHCRKPEPGMLWQAARELDIDLVGSYIVGDAATDLVAGERVGCRTFLVLTGRGADQLWLAFRAMGHRFAITRNLSEAALQIIEAERQEVAIT